MYYLHKSHDNTATVYFTNPDIDNAIPVNELPGGEGNIVVSPTGDVYREPLLYEQPYKADELSIVKAQIQAQTERSDFIEDCIAEMATVVYGGV